MVITLLIIDAVLPLYGLFFHTALLTTLGQWVLLPTHLLFPGSPLTPSLMNAINTPPSIPLSWQHTGLFLGALLLLFLAYITALRYLPQRITYRFILCSTLLLGAICVLMPIVSSQDLYSYIIYARMEVIYHVNPLITSPQAIMHDPTYQHIFWTDQPSAYGPTWIIITSALQWLTMAFGPSNIAPMVLALRLLGLAAHLWSIALIWSIGGHLQRQYTPGSTQLRLQATLAFAWNPLLLFEGCVNAHNDTIILLLVLLAIWFLVRQPKSYFFATLMLALATCLKVNILLFAPGYLLFLWLWSQRWQVIGAAIATYALTMGLLYAMFWHGGAILAILSINPGTYRNINTLPEFLSHFYDSITRLLGYPGAPEIGSPAEIFLREASIIIFIIVYAFSLWRLLRRRGASRSPAQLIRWMTWIWLLYCAIGTPWSWPWYIVTFFGLSALLEAIEDNKWPGQSRLLAFSALSVYCFYTWAPFASFIPWLPHFRWAWLRGLWVWLIPLAGALHLTNHEHETAL